MTVGGPDTSMEIGIVGAGLTGLAAAHSLCRRPGLRVSLLEREAQPGGRAGVVAGAEHCCRFFMGDYVRLLELLREVPNGTGTLADELRPVRRFTWTERRGWVEISGVYPSLSPELDWRERGAAVAASRRSLLLGQRSTLNQNDFGTTGNYTLRYAVSVARAMHTSRKAYVLPGPTDRLLVEPWLRDLRTRGVTLRCRVEVQRLVTDASGVTIFHTAGSERFDALLVTSFVSDAYALLDRSGIPRPLDWRRHTNCKCVTIGLDPDEPILRDRTQRAYTSAGLVLLVQPSEERCVALTTTLHSTRDADVVTQASRQLGLRRPPAWVRSRANLNHSSAVFAGDPVDPRRLEQAVVAASAGTDCRARVYFAGSYTRTSYPVDSAEAACRSADLAVARLAATLASPQSAYRAFNSFAHPNARTPFGRRDLLWSAACATGALVARARTQLSVDGARYVHEQAGRPAMLSVTATGEKDWTIAFALMHRLGLRPRLLVGHRAFEGATGRALHAIGALPAIDGSDATRNAIVAALRAGEQVAALAEGAEDVRVAGGADEVRSLAAAAGVPIISFRVRSARAQGRRRRVMVDIDRLGHVS